VATTLGGLKKADVNSVAEKTKKVLDSLTNTGYITNNNGGENGRDDCCGKLFDYYNIMGYQWSYDGIPDFDAVHYP
jgi:hypothetical protein